MTEKAGRAGLTQRLAERAEREQKVLDTVGSWLPELQLGDGIQIDAVDPEKNDGALFSIGRAPGAFVCRRGVDRD